MHLGDPKSAIISAVIFNALIIPALVPLALKGVRYRAIGATALLRRNLLIYGFGGMILPFVGIKLIDLSCTTCSAPDHRGPGIGDADTEREGAPHDRRDVPRSRSGRHAIW